MAADLIEAVDPLIAMPRSGMGCLAGNNEALLELSDRVAAQSVIFKETLSLFAHADPIS